jgi:hypothetical protein
MSKGDVSWQFHECQLSYMPPCVLVSMTLSTLLMYVRAGSPRGVHPQGFITDEEFVEGMLLDEDELRKALKTLRDSINKKFAKR